MKRILFLALALFTIHCSLFTGEANAQSRTNRIYRNCPGTTTKAQVALDAAGNISITPCADGTTSFGAVLVVDTLNGEAAIQSLAVSGQSNLAGVSAGSTTTSSLISSGVVRSTSPTAGIGYSDGAGGAVTQLTSKSTAVTSNTITTAVTMNNAILNAATIVSFTFTNSTIAATDTVLCTHESGGTSAAYTCNAFPGVGSAVVSVRNNTAGNLVDAPVLRITVIKSVSN